MNKNIIMWTIGIVVFIALVAFFVGQGEDITSPEEEEVPDSEVDLTDETEEEDENENNSQAPEAQVTDESMIVEDQPAGPEVMVSSISISDARWVVIHEDNNGEPGNILGARLFFSQHTEGRVSLLRATEPGEQYYALMYNVAEREDDQGRIFDRNRDVPLVDDSGELFMVPFTTLANDDEEESQ